MKSIAEKIADRAIKNSGLDLDKDYLELMNKLEPSDALAVSIVMMDREIRSADIKTWRDRGFSRSKRAMRVLNDLLPKMKGREAKEVLDLKFDYLYSVCEKKNLSSTERYMAVRDKFLPKFDKFMERIAA